MWRLQETSHTQSSWFISNIFCVYLHCTSNPFFVLMLKLGVNLQIFNISSASVFLSPDADMHLLLVLFGGHWLCEGKGLYIGVYVHKADLYRDNTYKWGWKN